MDEQNRRWKSFLVCGDPDAVTRPSVTFDVVERFLNDNPDFEIDSMAVIDVPLRDWHKRAGEYCVLCCQWVVLREKEL